MTKNTASREGMAWWPNQWTRWIHHPWWSKGLALAPWLGLVALVGQFWSKAGVWMMFDVEVLHQTVLSGVWWAQHAQMMAMVLLLLPVSGLGLDTLKWTLFMDEPEENPQQWGLRLKKNFPILCYGILGSLWFPARLTEFAGRCRFYPLQKHPRVMASTVLASSAQWFWVLIWPALLWWLVTKADKALWAKQWAWAPLQGPWLSMVLVLLAILVAWIWRSMYHTMGYRFRPIRSLHWVQLISMFRHGILLTQWVLWLNLLGLSMPWISVYFLVSLLLAVNWFAPLGLLGELGLRGLTSMLMFGNLLSVPTYAAGVPWLIWLTNVSVPAIGGALWWLFKGRYQSLNR
jgi:hypothetical protein